jgi:hypothetical protein
VRRGVVVWILGLSVRIKKKSFLKENAGLELKEKG